MTKYLDKELVTGVFRNLGTIINKILRRPNPLSPTKPLEQSSFQLNSDESGFLQRPCLRVKRKSDPEAVFVLAKYNYKVYAIIGQTIRLTKIFGVIIYTGADSMFIRLCEIPNAL